MEEIPSEIDNKGEVSPEKIQEIGEELERLSGLIGGAAAEIKNMGKFSGNEERLSMLNMKDLQDALETIEDGKRMLNDVLSSAHGKIFKDGKRSKNEE